MDYSIDETPSVSSKNKDYTSVDIALRVWMTSSGVFLQLKYATMNYHNYVLILLFR